MASGQTHNRHHAANFAAAKCFSFGKSATYLHLLKLWMLLACCVPANSAAAQYLTLDDPSASGGSGTNPQAVFGDTVVGWTAVGSASGFLYSISTNSFQDFSYPGFPKNLTYADGYDGSNVSGGYYSTDGIQHGYVYNVASGTFTSFDDPAGTLTHPRGISGNEVVGYYSVNGTSIGAFIYNTTTQSFTNFSDPLAANATDAWGISGHEIVGTYGGTDNIEHGFIYNTNLDTFTTLDDPLAVGETIITGIYGNYLVGTYDTSNAEFGFIYDETTSTFTTLSDPLGIETDAFGIDGTDVVGLYITPDNRWHGFIYSYSQTSTPEPGLLTLVLAAGCSLAAIIILRKRRQSVQEAVPFS